MIALQTAFREKHPVTHLVFSPDQGTIAVAQPHAGVTLLERATGRTVAVCPTPRRGVPTGLAFTGDGKLLVAASAKGLDVVGAGTGAAVGALRPGDGVMLSTTPAGVLAVWIDGRRREWTTAGLADGSSDRSWVYGRGSGKALAVAPLGRLAVVAPARGGVALFDFARRRVTARFERPGPKPAAPPALPVAQFCPLGRRVAVNDGTTLDVYDLAGTPDDGDEPADDGVPAPREVLSPVFTLRPDKPGEVRGWYPPFALLADGRGVLVKRPRNRVQLWDAPAGALVAEWSWRLEWVTCLAVAADGLTAAAGGRFGRVLLWDLD